MRKEDDKTSWRRHWQMSKAEGSWQRERGDDKSKVIKKKKKVEIRSKD